jgi:rubredoxin-NAD+ reductase
METVLIIGGGIAGFSLAREIRKLNPNQQITLLSRDTQLFDRDEFPRLLADPTAKATVTDYETLAQDLRLTLANCTVQSLDPVHHSVTTDQGEFEADRIILATGSSPMLPSFSRDLPGLMTAVTHVNILEKVRARLGAIRDVAIVGGGVAGCEFANALATLGKHVTVIEQHGGPLFELMPIDARRHLIAELEAIGVKFHFNARCASACREGLRAQLSLTDGKRVEADLVIAAIGTVPNTKLAQAAGLNVGKGIIVDKRMETSHTHIYALGDCAEVAGMVLPYRAPIAYQAKALAKTMNGVATAVDYPPLPISLNTPACPTMISPPKRGAQGQWETLVVENGLNASFVDDYGRLSGFVLMGAETVEVEFLKVEVPNWLNNI